MDVDFWHHRFQLLDVDFGGTLFKPFLGYWSGIVGFIVPVLWRVQLFFDGTLQI
jgi:hypothetical protein